jgi:hypothetical protein
MSNIGKYIWGESEDHYDSKIYDSIEECKKDIKDNYVPSFPWNPTNPNIYIGQITREFDFMELAQDIVSMAEERAREFDNDACIDPEITEPIESLIKDALDMRCLKVRTLEILRP